MAAVADVLVTVEADVAIVAAVVVVVVVVTASFPGNFKVLHFIQVDVVSKKVVALVL